MNAYPRMLQEFDELFGTEEACRNYLVQLRWPDGFQCPRCGNSKAWPTQRGLLRCANCDSQVSVIAGTIFQGTRLPLQTWFKAMWLVTNQKNGASALGLQRMLGFGSYRTAWVLLQKLRRAMVRPGRDKLSGRVEVDETYVGGAEEGVRGRQTEKKALVVIAAEENGKRIGRIRMQRVESASKTNLHRVVTDVIKSGSVVHTDTWSGYTGLEDKGYVHEKTKRKTSAPGLDMLPRIHLVASLLKRWLLGTHQGSVSREHLDYYLDEFTFRFNRRTSRYRGKLFFRLIQNAVTVPPTTYGEMVRYVRKRQSGKSQDVA